MTIDPLSHRRVSPPGRRPAARGTGGVGNFSEAMAGQTGEGAPSASTAGPVALDALLALLEVPAPGGDREAARHGEELLDALERLRLGLLTGAVPRATLEHLARLAGQQAARADDPRLSEVLREIELRAAVELAKLGH